MAQSPKVRIYTKAAKVYNLAMIGLITITGGVLSLGVVGSQTLSSLELFLSLAISVLFISTAVMGLVKEKSWVKWLFLGLYGFYILSALEGLLNAPPDAFGLWGKTRPLLNAIRLATIALSSLGIILLLQQPSPQD